MNGVRNTPDVLKSRTYRCEYSGCWIWTGVLRPDGYACVRYDGTQWLTHRLFYSLFVSVIQDGFDVHHRCRNKICCNPTHLETLLKIEHARFNAICGPFGLSARQGRALTHCKQGHMFDEDNTYWRKRSGGQTMMRMCKKCLRDRKKTYRRKMRNGG